MDKLIINNMTWPELKAEMEHIKVALVPVGSCEQVIHLVGSFAAMPALHHVGCAGIVDADARSTEEVSYLESKGIYCLPVSEVENLILLPEVFLAIAMSMKWTSFHFVYLMHLVVMTNFR